MARKKVVKSTRTAKSDAVKGDVEPELAYVPAISPAIRVAAPSEEQFSPSEADSAPIESEVTVRADMSAISLFEGAPNLPQRDELRPDRDLLEEEKAQFKALLDKMMPLSERASKLVKLAGMTGNKTAPVALRAIQVINEITGVSDDLSEDAPSMFSLPEGVKVKVSVETPEK